MKRCLRYVSGAKQPSTNWGKARKLLKEHGLALRKTDSNRRYLYYGAKCYGREMMIAYFNKERNAFWFVTTNVGVWSSYFKREKLVLMSKLKELGYTCE